jgi:hypothetical protein
MLKMQKLLRTWRQKLANKKQKAAMKFHPPYASNLVGFKSAKGVVMF